MGALACWGSERRRLARKAGRPSQVSAAYRLFGAVAFGLLLVGSGEADQLRADEPDAISSLVGDWDLRGTDTSLEIRPDHSVFHSRLGLGDIEHENVHYFKVEYRHTHLQCHYQIKKYSKDELSIVVSIRPADADCDLGEMRRAPGSIEPESAAAGEQDASGEPAQSESSNQEPPAVVEPSSPQESSPHVLALGEEKDLKPAATFKECKECPEMVVVPSGRFLMGSPASERGRQENEGPIHGVAIPKMIAVGQHAVTRDEFMAFVAATSYPYGHTCHAEVDNKWVDKPNASFSDPPGFSQQGRDPVVCVNWFDAQEYAKWLSAKTGKQYRLLSEAEREYVARAGTGTPYWWGDSATPQQANYDTRPRNHSDNSAMAAALVAKTRGLREAPHGKPRAVDSYQPNPWGLYNVHGNVAEWVEDCWNANYTNTPTEGSPARTGDCSRRVVKGGAWSYWPEDIRAAYREPAKTDGRYFHVGFRVARNLAQ